MALSGMLTCELVMTVAYTNTIQYLFAKEDLEIIILKKIDGVIYFRVCNHPLKEGH